MEPRLNISHGLLISTSTFNADNDGYDGCFSFEVGCINGT